MSKQKIRETRYTCDVCGHQINGYRRFYSFTKIRMDENGTYSRKSKHERLDMCPDCYEQFIINIGAINRKKEREAEKQNAQT